MSEEMKIPERTKRFEAPKPIVQTASGPAHTENGSAPIPDQWMPKPEKPVDAVFLVAEHPDGTCSTFVQGAVSIKLVKDLLLETLALITNMEKQAQAMQQQAEREMLKHVPMVGRGN